jgi:RecA-family ATPase
MSRDFNDVLREEGIEAARKHDASAVKYRPEPLPQNDEEEDDIPKGADVFTFRPRTERVSTPAIQLMWLDLSPWDDEPVPQRDWVIPNRVPAEQFGLFSGEGGIGKSIIELMRDVAHVTGRDWFGSLPEPGPVIYVGTEDSAKELHIRLAAIAKYYNVKFKDLVDGGLHVLPLIDDDATLATVSRAGAIEPTLLFHKLLEAAGDIKPINISLDPLSSIFGGNEIDRVQVYAFRRHMMALAKATRRERRTGAVFGGSITLLAHPSLAGIASGTGLSGSTAWHGAPRFRMYLKGVKDDAAEGEQPESDLRQLEFKKTQYGPLGESIVLQYQNGVFVPVRGVSDIEKAAHDIRVEDLFIDLLRRYEETGRHVSRSKHSGNYAATLFAEEPEAKGLKLRRKDLEVAMSRLFTKKKLDVKPYGPPSKGWFRLAEPA